MTSKIKILYIIDKMDRAGTQKHLLEVLRLINKDIFEPHLCCLARIGEMEAELEKIDITPKTFRIKRIYGYSGIMGIIGLTKYIKKERFAIVHTYLFLANLAGNIAAKLAGTPVIISGRRDTGAPCEGHWYHNLAYKLAHSLANKVIPNSKTVAETVVTKESVPVDKIAVIQNGMDCAKLNTPCRLNRKDIGLEQGDFVVNMTGNFSWVKNHNFLLDAAPEIIKNNNKIKFLLVGDGELRRGLQAKVKALGLEDNTIFLGKRTDVLDLLRISDIALNLSFTEGSSNSVLEAMALGKPVVATDISANKELFPDELKKYLVPLGNKQALVEAILKLFANPTERQSITGILTEHISRNFMLSDKINQLESLYMSLLDKKPRISEKKMRIIFLLTDALRVGGAQKNILSLAGYLSAKGHKVFIAAKPGGSNRDIEKSGANYIETDFHFKGINGINTCANKLRGIITEHNLNIVAPQSLRTAIIASRAIKNLPIAKPAVISTIYNIGSEFYSLIAGCLLNRTSDYVIFESNYERNRLLKRGLHPHKSEVAYTGINLQEFSPQEKDAALASNYGLNNGQFVIGSISRLSGEKDIATLMRAIAITAKTIDKIKLMLVGDGPLREGLKSLAYKLRIEDKVIFAGMQPDTKKFLSLFDLFVLSSRRESLSMAAREAMAMGKTVIISNVGGAGEMIDDGKDGILAPARRPDILSEKIKLAISNKELRQKLGNEARLKTERFFNRELWLKTNEEIYLRFTGAYA